MYTGVQNKLLPEANVDREVRRNSKRLARRHLSCVCFGGIRRWRDQRGGDADVGTLSLRESSGSAREETGEVESVRG